MVYARSRPQSTGPRLLPNGRPDFSRVELIGKDEDTSPRGCQTGQLLHYRAAYRPGEEEDYELNLYISTFVSEDTPTVPTSRVHITVKPPTVKVVDPQQTEQQQPIKQT